MHDSEQLGNLLAGLGPRLEAVALRITRHPEHARDVVQNAFEKVLRHGGGFQGESKVSTWIHRIVTNEALMWLRSQRRRSEVQADSELLDGPGAPQAAGGPAEHSQRRENVRELQRSLLSLSEDERDVILRCALAEESYAAYGSRTGVHPAAVKSRAFRARRRLGELLADRTSLAG